MAAKGALPASVAAQAHVRAVETPVIGLRSGAARRGPADPRLGWRQRSGSQSGSWAATSRPPPACPARSTRRSSSAAPVQASFETGNIQHLMFGMAGIAGNAFGFTAPPSPAQQAAACRPFHRGALLGQHANAPMLVLNGTDDVHVVQADTLVFSSPPGTEVILVRDPGTARPPSCPR